MTRARPVTASSEADETGAPHKRTIGVNVAWIKMEARMQSKEIAPGSSLTGAGDRVVVNVFADATKIAHALGLNIELPDSDNADPAYWELVHADGGFKPRIAGQIADPWWNGDPDWALLIRLPEFEVWFDIEEGVKLFLLAADIGRALDLLDRLRTQGIALTGDDGRRLVWVTPTRLDAGGVARVRAHLESAGLVRGRNEIVWELPPGRSNQVVSGLPAAILRAIAISNARSPSRSGGGSGWLRQCSSWPYSR